MTTFITNRRLTRTQLGDYKVHLPARISHEAHVFFLNHEESKDAAMALGETTKRVPRPDDVEDEEVTFMFAQTRGGAFKILEPSYYYVDASTPKGQRKVYRENLPNYGRNNPNITEDDFTVEPHDRVVTGRLVPCTYRFG